jgi:hypothetical protein
VIGVEHEAARPPTGDGFVDAVTVSWGDRGADLYGLARIGFSAGGASALAVLFSGREPVAALARDGLAADGADWASVQAGGLAMTTAAPLERWTVRFASEDGRRGFEFELEAASEPAALDDAVARSGGMEGYEQLCVARGSVLVDGATREVACLGQRGHTWGAPDWSRIALARSLTVWADGGPGVALSAIRPAGAANHAQEDVWAALLGPDEVTPIADPRLSTTYDGDGHQRRAGLELWVADDDDMPERATGEVLCGSTLELGPLALDLAFFAWHFEGREGVGRYDVLRPA